MRARLTTFIAGIFAVLFGSAVPAADLATQSSNASGVTVTVTPQNLAANAKSWDFKVGLNTHSQDLSDDLVKSSTLLDDRGGRHAPVRWEGAGPGGHHRQGTLSFNAITPQPKAIELQIRRPAESAPRSFRWQLK